MVKYCCISTCKQLWRPDIDISFFRLLNLIKFIYININFLKFILVFHEIMKSSMNGYVS